MAVGGLILLVGGLIALIGRRFDDLIPVERRGLLRSGALVAAPLLVGGLLLADLRRIPDAIGALLLAVTFIVMLVALGTVVLGLRSGRASTAQGVVAGVAGVVAVVASVLVLVITVDLLSLLIFWVRGTFPRFRIDQLMGFAWKVLVPLALVVLLLVAIVIKLPLPGIGQQAILFVTNVAVLLGALWFFGRRLHLTAERQKSGGRGVSVPDNRSE